MNSSTKETDKVRDESPGLLSPAHSDSPGSRDTPSPEPNEPKDSTYKPTSGSRRGRKRKKPEFEDSGSDGDGPTQSKVTFPASKLFEYEWPVNSNDSRWYMLQEQVAEFLDIRGMQRRYPDLERRPLDFQEKKYLLDIEAVTETQCNMGLVALVSDEVLELMFEEFSDKYKEYVEAQSERQFQQAVDNTMADMKTLAESQVTRDCDNAAEQLKVMVNETVLYNSYCHSLKRRNHQSYCDQQTMIQQVPRPVIIPQKPQHRSKYPVAVIPGQHCDIVPRYSSSDLKQLPLKTAVLFPSSSS